jgi:hypothetical protein
MNIAEILAATFLGAWLIFSIIYLIYAYRKPGGVNPYLFESIPQVFPTIGILGTFMGIAYGLWKFDVEKIEESIPNLIDGLKTAFLASIGGVALLIIFSKITAYIQNRNEKGKLSDETVAINRLIEAVTDLKNSLDESFTFKDDNGNKVKPGNVLRDMYQESAKQTQALKTFSTDIAVKIEASFDQIMSQQIQSGVIPELQSLKAEIEKLGSKLQDPAAEMTQNVVKDLQTAMGGMINEFKTSISGSAKSELEHLTSLLSQAGSSLVTFPETLKNMTNNLNENFLRLQEVVDGVAKRTLDQSTTSTEQMKRQVEEMSAILSAKVGDLQNGQEILVTKQSENLQSSDSLLKAFNESISGLTNLSEEIAGSLASYQSVHRELNSAASQLRNVSENVGVTTSSLKELQGKFVYNSEVFLQKNVETIEAVRTTLDRAKDVSSEFATKFDIIEKGLQGIFEQIDSGLKGYRDTIGESLQKYLSNYSEALTTTAGSLTAVVEKQEDILEELSEQISRIEFKR